MSRGAATLLLLAGCAGPQGAPEAPVVRIHRRLAAMGTGLAVTVEAATRPEALAASERAVRAIEATEERLSTWRGTSELSRLNAAAAGEPVALSPALAHDLRRAAELHARTGGAFDPALGPLVAAWNLRGAGRVPAPAELEAARAASGWHHYALRDDRLARDDERAGLEEGAFGKGIGLDAALDAIPAGDASLVAIELGGQWVVRAAGGASFTIGVAHPELREEPVARLRLSAGSVATSGNSERAVVVDGERLGHILDPRSGRPAPDFGSVTVLAPDATTADAAATAVFVLGPDAGLAWARAQADVEALVLELAPERPAGLRARATAGLAAELEPLLEGLVIETLPNSPEARAASSHSAR